jgi:hypothetical protein
LLVLLENYVLSCIGQLPRDKESRLSSITEHVFGGGSDWKTTLRARLQLSDTIDFILCQMWTTNQKRAQLVNQSLSPEDFARMVVDQNFAHLVPGE